MMVQNNPQILQPMLQELGKQNPQLLSMINSNQAEFLQLINEAGAEGESAEAMARMMGAAGAMDADTGEPGQQHTIEVTQEESEAIERLQGLGFSRDAVLEAFFACDKDENAAANFLLNSQFQDD